MGNRKRYKSKYKDGYTKKEREKGKTVCVRVCVCVWERERERERIMNFKSENSLGMREEMCELLGLSEWERQNEWVRLVGWEREREFWERVR